ncbi:MAG: metallophosphoesterase [Pseudomonadota bacterium]|nr:metallophosphoesterase [Pseudomonadota bacterium]MDP1903138.1 metallophosphoesterase [Pseudomonadota bacterium]
MKIHLLSDIHNEFDYFLPDPAAKAADVVILAGDIHLGIKGVEWAKKTFSAPVLYVPGNHEYYDRNLGKTLVKMIDTGDDHVRVLDCEEVVIQGVRFLGATAWTDYSLAGDARLAMSEAREVMTDFRKIRVGSNYRKLTPLDLLERNRYSKQWLANKLAEPFDGATVVMTHHAPSLRSLYPEGLGEKQLSFIDAAYANAWENMMDREKVGLWVHGHTHVAVDYLINGTRVVCNPRGYPDEDTGFNPALLIELE